MKCFVSFCYVHHVVLMCACVYNVYRKPCLFCMFWTAFISNRWTHSHTTKILHSNKYRTTQMPVSHLSQFVSNFKLSPFYAIISHIFVPLTSDRAAKACEHTGWGCYDTTQHNTNKIEWTKFSICFAFYYVVCVNLLDNWRGNWLYLHIVHAPCENALCSKLVLSSSIKNAISNHEIRHIH